MTIAAHRWFIAVAITVAGCSNIGPFRANGGDDDVDAAVGGDGRQADSATGGGDGQQVAEPRELATSTHYPTYLAAADGMAYFTESGVAPYGVARVSAAGGAVTRIDLGATPPSLIVARGSDVVWTADNAVVRANSSFTGSDPLVTTTQLTGEIALSSADVYYGRHGGGTNAERLERVALSGGTPDPVYTTLATAPELTSNATDLYWTAYDGGYEVRKSSFTAPGSFTTLSNAAAGTLSASGNVACWVQQPDPNQYKYDVWCYRQGGAARIARDYYQIFDVLVTASDVFIAVRGYNNVGEIWRYHLATQVLDSYITLDTGDLPTALATDGTDLMWIAYHAVPEGSGAIYALAL